MADRALLVMTRAPEAGRAKTRLIPALGADDAAALHAALVTRTLETAGGDWDLQLWCHPDRGHPFFARCAQRFDITLHGQRGEDLGQRMHVALADALASHRHAVLVGTDCPSLATADIEAAFDALAAGADVVLGPAADGGYYLVGLNRASAALFSGIDWGSPRVLEQTLAHCAGLGFNHRLLTVRQDLDTPPDLEQLPDRAALIARGRSLAELDR